MDSIPTLTQHPLMDVVQELTARVKKLEAERDHWRMLASGRSVVLTTQGGTHQ